MKILQMNNLSINYGENTIIEHLNLTLKQDELLVILGPSGCGKSTLLYSLSGLLQPDHGEIIFDDAVLFSAVQKINVPPEQRRMGFVFQDYSLWPHMSVFENIAYPLRVQKHKKEVIEKRVTQLLESVSLLHKRNAFPSELSGGEKQRVAIARAIAVEPMLMLLDEPLANVDAVLKTQLLSLISQLKTKLGIPMIYVTHDQKEAFEIADRMIIMKDGKIVQEGTPQSIYRFPVNEFVAGFVGENNLIDSGCLNKRMDCCKQKALCTVRPEDICICEEGEYSGQIQKIVYKGNGYNLHVKTENSCFVISESSESYQVGDVVRFDLMRMHMLNKK